jgi:DNA-binding transcriptional LysR family regulator
MAIDPRLLRSFVVLAEELHFGRAADRLNVAQPGLSQQLHRLEDQAGSQLFTRNSRVVELTDAGRAMLEPARAALRAADQAERAAREASRTTAHPLRVGVNYFLDDMVPAVAAYAAAHHDMQLWVTRMHEQQGLEMLQAGLLDAVVGSVAATDSESSEVRQRRAMDIPLFALLGVDHPLARRSEVPLAVYRRSPIAIFGRDQAPGQFDCFVDVLSQGEGRGGLSMREFRPTGTGMHPEILAEIGAGHAVGFGTPASLAAGASHLRLLPFDPALKLPIYISWRPERSPHIDTFVEHLSTAT